MAEGVRIRHTVLRAPEGDEYMVVAIRDMTRRSPVEPLGGYRGCGACQLSPPGHEGYSTKHVRIDSDGYGIVSAPYWENIKKFIDQGGFEMSNVIDNPPRQGIALGANGTGKLTVYHKMTRPILAPESTN